MAGGGRPYVCSGNAFERDRHVFVNGLPLIVVFGIELPVRPGDGLRSLVSFEPQIPYLVLVRLLLVAQAFITEHQVVMRLQILGINRERGIEFLDGIAVLPSKKENPAQFVAHYPVARILSDHFA